MREEMTHKMHEEVFSYAPHYGMMPHMALNHPMNHPMNTMNPQQFYPPHHPGMMKDEQGGGDGGNAPATSGGSINGGNGQGGGGSNNGVNPNGGGGGGNGGNGGAMSPQEGVVGNHGNYPHGGNFNMPHHNGFPSQHDMMYQTPQMGFDPRMTYGFHPQWGGGGGGGGRGHPGHPMDPGMMHFEGQNPMMHQMGWGGGNFYGGPPMMPPHMHPQGDGGGGNGGEMPQSYDNKMEQNNDPSMMNGDNGEKNHNVKDSSMKQNDTSRV